MKKKKELKISRRTVMKGALAAGAMMSAGSIPSKLFAGEYNIPDPLKPLMKNYKFLCSLGKDNVTCL